MKPSPPVCVPALVPEVLYLLLGIALGAGLFQGVLIIVKDLRQILNREKNSLIVAGLMLFVITRAIEWLYV